MRKRRAKIVATLGPSSSSVATLEKLLEAGLDVARVNMSHGTHEYHAETIKNIRQASQNVKREIAILADLQGPKIRVDKLPEPLELKAGETWFIGQLKDQAKHKNFIPTVYNKLVEDCHVGARILFDDGLLEAQATNKEGHLLEIKVIVGGTLKSNKGINLPNVKVSAPSLTEKDEKDLYFALKQEVDYVALSFVREAEDVKKVKYLLHKLKLDTPIISKIEKPEAIKNIDEIIEVSDVIMIARGDMGVELGNHLVPSVQKQIIEKCNHRGVPVITATQMLESMIHNSRPTRAEASDVANAIWDGTDAVMLSGETAVGDYPIETIKMMSDIVVEAEKQPRERPLLRHMDLSSVSAANQVAASLIAEKVNAKWIVSLTQRGNSCLKMTRFRPKSEVLGVTPSLKAIRRMSLYWGITPFLVKTHTQDMLKLEAIALNRLKTENELQNGDKIVITHGDGHYFSNESSNSIRVEIIKDLVKESASSHRLQKVQFDRGLITLDTDVCASCQSCLNVCPFDIWVLDEKNNTKINENQASKCTLDMTCVEVCPTGAIEIVGKLV